tara:strand:- start:10977 stop:11240 length:264 start_codon:yes stop_codon:yes gene_type:complete
MPSRVMCRIQPIRKIWYANPETKKTHTIFLRLGLKENQTKAGKRKINAASGQSLGGCAIRRRPKVENPERKGIPHCLSHCFKDRKRE